ncbi:MAG: hypothetical protein ACLFTH_02355 [Candidatus Woesearchaeota archaeon]
MGLRYRFKRYFSFTGKEHRDIFLTALVMTMALFFYLWARYPDTDIMLATGAISLVNALILLVIAHATLIVMVGSGKAIAILRKYTANYTSWFNGLLIGFVITFASYGYLPVVFPGLLTMTKITRLRYGKPMEGENRKDIYKVLIGSLFSVAIIGLVFQQLYLYSNSIIFQGAKDLASFILIYAILPFPNNYGSHMFYTKKKQYFMHSFFFLVLSLAIIFNSPFAIIIGIVGGALLWLIFSRFYGKEILQEP